MTTPSSGGMLSLWSASRLFSPHVTYLLTYRVVRVVRVPLVLWSVPRVSVRVMPSRHVPGSRSGVPSRRLQLRGCAQLRPTCLQPC